MRFSGCGREVRFVDCVGWELRELGGGGWGWERVWKRAGQGKGREGRTNVDVSVDDFVRVCFGYKDAVYGCCCVGHGRMG